MGRRQQTDDDPWDEPDLDASAVDDGVDDGVDTIPCPYCGREIYEESPRCPHCGEYISREDAPAGRKPRWIIVGALLCLAAAIAWIVVSWN